MASLLKEIGAGLIAVIDGEAELGRLELLALLADERLARQLELSRKAATHLLRAEALQAEAKKRLGLKAQLVCWSFPDALSTTRDGNRTSRERVEQLRSDAERRLAGALRWVLDRTSRTGVAAPMAELLEPLRHGLPAAEPLAPERRIRPAGVTRVGAGPASLPPDPSFEPAYSYEDHPPKDFSGEDFVPSCLALGLREAAAAALCALNAVEYDGLPLAFYADFSRQAWDEMRHATFLVDAGTRLLGDFTRDYPAHPAAATARAHLASGNSLPIPHEGNHYELMWNATLEERLTLMHHDTEAPSVGDFKALLKKGECRKHLWFAHGIELIAGDEAFHGRLGKTWLKFLLPDKDARERAIGRARAHRGLLVLTSLSHRRGVPLVQLLDRYAAPAGA